MSRYSVLWTDPGGVIRAWDQEEDDGDIPTLHGALGIAESLFKRGARDVTIYDDDYRELDEGASPD